MDDFEPLPEYDTYLTEKEELMSLKEKIGRGKGSSEDLERVLELGVSYYKHAITDERFSEKEGPVKELVVQALRYNEALSNGSEGRREFCRQEMIFHSEAEIKSKNKAVARDHRSHAQNWAVLMKAIAPENVKP